MENINVDDRKIYFDRLARMIGQLGATEKMILAGRSNYDLFTMFSACMGSMESLQKHLMESIQKLPTRSVPEMWPWPKK